MKILVAIDFSESARVVMDCARELAQAYSAEVIVPTHGRD